MGGRSVGQSVEIGSSVRRGLCVLSGALKNAIGFLLPGTWQVEKDDGVLLVVEHHTTEGVVHQREHAVNVLGSGGSRLADRVAW